MVQLFVWLWSGFIFSVAFYAQPSLMGRTGDPVIIYLQDSCLIDSVLDPVGCFWKGEQFNINAFKANVMAFNSSML